MSGQTPDAVGPLIDYWRSRMAVTAKDASTLAEFERHLRVQAQALTSAGLAPDEAFLVALKRISAADPALRGLARQVALELLASPEESVEELSARTAVRREFMITVALAAGAAVAIKAPTLLGYQLGGAYVGLYLRNLSVFALPFLAAFLAWRYHPQRPQLAAMAAAFAGGAVLANAYPFVSDGSTQALTALHLPVALWLVAGLARAGGAWRSVAQRMEYVRFTGEWFVTYTLIVLGLGVLAALTIGVFEAIGVNAATFVSEWLIPCGAMGAVVVSAWVVETRHTLAGGIAPMLARVFTPLFALLLVALLVGVIWSKGVINVGREVLIFFDVLLVVVLALVLYAISARDAQKPPSALDRLQLVLVSAALAVDVFALANIVFRLTEFGFSANRAAALGLNLVLLVNLARTAVLQARFVRSGRGLGAIERWQMRYLPVWALWAAFVVVAFPPLFGFQ